MKFHKHISRVGLAAVLLLLLSNPGAADSGFGGGFDGGFEGISLSESVRSMKERSRRDSRTPVPSTPTHSNELNNFWDNLKEHTFDKLCRDAQIALNGNASVPNVAGIGGGIKRYLKPYPLQKVLVAQQDFEAGFGRSLNPMKERIGLVDEIQLKLNVSLGTEKLPISEYGYLRIGISGGMEGTSIVVRPLEGTHYCKHLGKLVELYEMKTVLPINAKRITEMANGEIWKLPMVVRFNIGVSVGARYNDVVTVSVGASETMEKRQMVSLNRLDDNNLRMRLRLDHVTLKTLGSSASTIEIPAGDLGLLKGEDLIAKNVNRTLAREINKLIAFKLGYSHEWVGGQKLLMEFYFNPKKPEHIARLAEFLDGDLSTLREFVKMGLKFDTFVEESNGQSGVGELEQLGTQTGESTGVPPSFVGSDHYDTESDNFNLNIPIIHSLHKTWASSYHRYQSLKNEGVTVHVQQKTRVSSADTINLPFMGTRIRHNSQKDIYVVNRESSDGSVTKPVLLFQKYEGFVRQGDSTAREMIDDVNDVLKYAGMQGNGVNMNNLLPSAEIFPPLPPQYFGYDPEHPQKTYRSAVIAFKLVFSEKAVQDIIFAPAQLIMKSFMNVMRGKEGEIIDKIIDLFTINERGEVGYDRQAVSKRLDVHGFNDGGDWGTNPLGIVKSLASGATEFIKKILSVRKEADWKAQAERLSEVASSGDMRYEDFLKVVIQMVSPSDISSSFYIHTDKRIKGEANVTQTYNIFNNHDNDFDSEISDVIEMRELFANPPVMSD